MQFSVDWQPLDPSLGFEPRELLLSAPPFVPRSWLICVCAIILLLSEVYDLSVRDQNQLFFVEVLLASLVEDTCR